MTVFALWEALAGIGEGGAAAREAVGVVELDARGLVGERIKVSNRYKANNIIEKWLTCRGGSTYSLAMVADPSRQRN